MKTILVILLVAVASTIAVGQNSGVYMTPSDFGGGKLTYSIDCRKEKHKIRLNEFLGKNYITVIHNGESYNLKKSEIFGYRECSGKISRLGIGVHYELMNPGETILLYKTEILVSKNQPKATTYYFSNSASGQILELTLVNIKRAFPDNHKFHDALDIQFKVDADLVEYDSFHQEYKINRIHSNSGN